MSTESLETTFAATHIVLEAARYFWLFENQYLRLYIIVKKINLQYMILKVFWYLVWQCWTYNILLKQFFIRFSIEQFGVGAQCFLVGGLIYYEQKQKTIIEKESYVQISLLLNLN